MVEGFACDHTLIPSPSPSGRRGVAFRLTPGLSPNGREEDRLGDAEQDGLRIL